MASGLDDLSGLLTGDRLDGAAIARSLSGLADATRAADTTDARIRPRLDRLAASLDRAAALDT